jgi:Flp pilus assembly pilin Flp
MRKLTLVRKIRGQGMTEYIIIVALIAVAAIGIYRLFGDTVRPAALAALSQRRPGMLRRRARLAR